MLDKESADTFTSVVFVSFISGLLSSGAAGGEVAIATGLSVFVGCISGREGIVTLSPLP